MLHIKNAAALQTPIAIAAPGGDVTFDTVVYSTNSAAELKGNAVLLHAPGVYDGICTITLQNEETTAATVSLQAYADGKAIPGAIDTVTIAADGAQAALSMPWPVKVVEADSGVATVSWKIIGGPVSLANAYATVRRHV